MKSAEIKDLSVKELQERIDVEKAQLSKLKLQHGVSPIENPSIIKKSRRDIARMLTILRQKNPKCQLPLWKEILEKSVLGWLSATKWRKPSWLQWPVR